MTLLKKKKEEKLLFSGKKKKKALVFISALKFERIHELSLEQASSHPYGPWFPFCRHTLGCCTESFACFPPELPIPDSLFPLEIATGQLALVFHFHGVH